jgi:ribosomal protein L31
MMTMVRVVLSNGSSIMLPQAWQQPLSAVGRKDAALLTKFLDVDYTNHERFTGVASRSSKRVGRRAKFDNKFSSPPAGTTSSPTTTAE